MYNGLPHYIAGAGDVLIVDGGYVGLIESDKPVSAMAVTQQSSGLVDEELLFPLKSVIIDQFTFSTLEYSVSGKNKREFFQHCHSASFGREFPEILNQNYICYD